VDSARQDEADESSLRCSVIGEAEEGFRSAVFDYSSDVLVPGGEL
jgi:hypothetical protein